MHSSVGLSLGTVFVSVMDPDWIRITMESLDPDSQSGSGSRRAQMTYKNRKKLICSLLRAEGFSCTVA
jgi:hypothetical protein